MRKITLLIASLFLTIGAMAQTFSEPKVGRFYKIKGDSQSNPWVTANTNSSGSVAVSANEADAAVFEKTANGLKAVSTGKYLGYSGGKYTYSTTEIAVELVNTGSQANDESKYAIKSGNNWMFNNNTDGIVHESDAWLDLPRLWGFIEVPNPLFIVGDGIYTIQADVNGRRGYLAASSEHDRPVLADISWNAGVNNNYTLNSCTSIVVNGRLWYVKNVDGVTYLYNIGKAEFVYDNNTDNIFFGDPYALNFTKHTSNSVEYIHVGSGNGTRYLSMGCGTTAPNQVKWEKSNGNDGGCLLTFNFVSDGETTYATEIAAAEAKIALQKLSSWKEEKLAKVGYLGGYQESAREQIESITTYEEMNEFDKIPLVLTPNTDAYYRIVCVAPKTDNNGDTSYKTLAFDGSSNLVTSPANNSNINQIFKFEDAGNGKFYLKNMNADGYLNKIGAGDYRSQIVTKSNACKLELTHYGNMQWKLHNSEGEDKHCLFAENHPRENVPYACSGWESGANSASAWYIIEAKDVEITVNEYATVYLPFAVAVEGATVYAVESTNATHAILAEKADIPANEGAILAGNGTATLNIIDAATADWSANKLEGTTIDTMIQGAAYVLAIPKGETTPCLCPVSLNQVNNTSFKNNANKAYLPTVSGVAMSASLRFDFGGTTTVEEVETENAEAVIYDLSGRRINEITEAGIYIIGGKKVLVK